MDRAKEGETVDEDDVNTDCQDSATIGAQYAEKRQRILDTLAKIKTWGQKFGPHWHGQTVHGSDQTRRATDQPRPVPRSTWSPSLYVEELIANSRRPGSMAWFAWTLKSLHSQNGHHISYLPGEGGSATILYWLQKAESLEFQGFLRHPGNGRVVGIFRRDVPMFNKTTQVLVLTNRNQRKW